MGLWCHEATPICHAFALRGELVDLDLRFDVSIMAYSYGKYCVRSSKMDAMRWYGMGRCNAIAMQRGLDHSCIITIMYAVLEGL